MDRDARLLCRECGAEMNPHAEKLVYTDEPTGSAYDPSLGGTLERHFACPTCGASDVRAVQPDAGGNPSGV